MLLSAVLAGILVFFESAVVLGPFIVIGAIQVVCAFVVLLAYSSKDSVTS